jgi:group I intron endonuclease
LTSIQNLNSLAGLRKEYIMHSIYKIINKVNGKPYIGQTKHSLDHRFKGHCDNAKRSDLPNIRLYKAFRKYGMDNFVIELLEQVETQEQANEREIHHIDQCDSMKNGYNMTRGEYKKREFSPEHREKLSLANYWKGKPRSGELNPMFGRNHTDEAKHKMGVANKGNQTRLGAILSDDTKAKISASRMGQPSARKGAVLTDETKQKMSLAHIGKSVEKKRKEYRVVTPTGAELIIKGLVKFALENGLNAGNLIGPSGSKGYYAQKI